MEIGNEFLKLVEKEGDNANTDANDNGGDNSGQNDDSDNGGANLDNQANDNADLANEGAQNDDNNNGGSENTDGYTEDFQKQVVDFMTKKTGNTYESVEDLFKKPEPVQVEVEKVVEKNPYEKLDPKVKSFLDFHTETGRGYEDYQKLNQDISTISDLDLARERVLSEADSSLELTPEDIDAYLEKQLNIDLSDITDLDKTDKIALSAFTKSFREQKRQEQEKYKQPIATNDNQLNEADMVTLEDGQKMPKAVYDDLLSKRTQYLEDVKKASDSINAASIQVKFDDKGSEKTQTFSYDFSAEDKHSMVSMAQDVNKTIADLFRTEEGFNHAGFLETMPWINPKTREKMVSSLIQKAVAQNTEELMKEIDNVNLGGSQNNLPGSKAKRTVPITPDNSGFGVKFQI